MSDHVEGDPVLVTVDSVRGKTETGWRWHHGGPDWVVCFRVRRDGVKEFKAFAAGAVTLLEK